MQSSYKKDEVTLLLKDISGQVEPYSIRCALFRDAAQGAFTE